MRLRRYIHFTKQIGILGHHISLWIGVLFVVSAGAVVLYASDGYTVNNGTTSGDITGPDSVCKKVTNNSGVGSSEYVPTASTVEWQSFYNNPPAGVTVAACAPVCSGASIGGYCWYLGAAGASCDTTCASHGGCNLTGIRDYAGSPSTGWAYPDSTRDTNCWGVMAAFGYYDDYAARRSTIALGCTIMGVSGVPRAVRWTDVSTNPTTCGASYTGVIRACSCNN